jgi:hypothetical protein
MCFETNTPLETLLKCSLFLSQLRDVDVVTEILLCCLQNQWQFEDIPNVEREKRIMLGEASTTYRPAPSTTYPGLGTPPAKKLRRCE